VAGLARRLSPPLHGHHSVSVLWLANVQLRAAGTLSQVYSWHNKLALVSRSRPRNARRPAHISGSHGAAVQEYSAPPTNRPAPLFRPGARVGARALESPSNTDMACERCALAESLCTCLAHLHEIMHVQIRVHLRTIA